MSNINFNSTFKYKVIYVFRINNDTHRGCLKVGEATVSTKKMLTELQPNSHDLNVAAKSRIDMYTSTAGVSYELLHTEVAVYNVDRPGAKNHNKLRAFRDHSVHSVLKRSGVESKYFDTNKKQNEWFITDLQTVKNAIAAVKANKTALHATQITDNINPIIFRPEQKEAIDKTIKRYKTSTKMLWYAKMRFGKTLSALQVAKQMNFNKTIIVTHRPVVSDGWFEDFSKVFFDKNDVSFGSKTKGKKISDILINNNKCVYFASMQDLRGSSKVGGNFEKNNEIFSVDWDFIVIDEAHEGTQTTLGENVVKALKNTSENHKTYVLELSGTPFNLLSEYEPESIYTWDYIMEQDEKNSWYTNHHLDSNPYEELPKMNIFTYHLEQALTGYVEAEDKAFNFKEFFRTWTGDISKDFEHIKNGANVGDFVHEKDVLSFLDLICKKDDKSNYPFSTEEHRTFFRHSLWILPGVKEAKAFSKLLKKHRIFQHFTIVNVAGEGDEEANTINALDAVKVAIGNNPDETYTITLSCGRLTTGVSVPEWTAVLMLSGTYSTAASQYLQTIFRVQTPANINGKLKENCYVFDFAPDRTLKMIAESVQLSARTSNNPIAEISLGKFLNFCPVISIDNTGMKRFKVEYLLQELKKAYVERVARNGFDDPKIYNDELLKLTEVELNDFNELKKIVGASKQSKKANDIDVNAQGFTNEEYEQYKKDKKKKNKEISEEEKKVKDNRASAISILRAISIRIPLMIYGIDININEDVTIDDFFKPEYIDDLSWNEFMPKGVNRDMFKKFAKYYDKDIFIAAGRRIRTIAKSADELEPTERIKKIAELFSTFKNPDKETVLTPWRVVNMHLSDTIGGYNFFEEKYEKIIDDPRYIEHENITKDIFNEDSNILEINSKTGLYPLYVAYSTYRSILDEQTNFNFENKRKIWDTVCEKNIFVICKTPMAKLITKRTLVGYRNSRVNTKYFEDLINQLKNKETQFIEKVTKKSEWKKGDGKMKFNAVVGNPPYQGTNHQQIYPYFYAASLNIGENVSLIFPVGWQKPKNANSLSKLNTPLYKEDEQIVFIDNRQNVFPEVSGAEWVNIILWKKEYNNELGGYQKILTNGEDPKTIKLLCEENLQDKPKEILELNNLIQDKIKNFKSIQSVTSSSKPYGLRTDLFSKPEKYKIFCLQDTKLKEDDIKIYGNKFTHKYLPASFDIPKLTKSFMKYKVFVTYAWGNMDEKAGLGGAFSNVIIGKPNEIVTETYLESGCFDTFEMALKHAKYMMTQFFRALLFINKTSQHSTGKFGAIPLEDYKEDWWEESISYINEKLFEKYSIPDDIKKFVNSNLQLKTEDNIIK